MRIELQNIVKAYGDVTVVKHVHLTIEEGEFFTLLGPSGCGKTTLLRMIAGFHSPDTGEINFNGKSILSKPAHKRNTGMVFQNYALFPHLTIFENVAYGLRARNVAEQEIKERVATVLDAVQLFDMAKRYPRQLSGGQQQRVALARALVIRPDVLLMDEPLSNLDAKLRISMREEIRRIQKNLGITTIYVTHDQEEAMAVSDRIAILHDGVLQQVDEPRGIYFRPCNRFVSQFMGECNFFEVQSHAYDEQKALSEVVCDGQKFFMRATFNEEKQAFMLRPDWIRVEEGLHVEEHKNENAFKGKILEISFLGTLTVYTIEALGRTLRVDVPARDSLLSAKEGDEVTLFFAYDAPVAVRS